MREGGRWRRHHPPPLNYNERNYLLPSYPSYLSLSFNKIHSLLTHVCLQQIGCFYFCCYAITSSLAVQKRHSEVYGNPIAPSFYSILLGVRCCIRNHIHTRPILRLYEVETLTIKTGTYNIICVGGAQYAIYLLIEIK